MSKTRFSIITLILLIMLPRGADSGESPTDLHAYLDQFRDDLDLASVAVALVKGEETVWKGATGKVDIENSDDATTRHLYPLGSVSKLFTGATFLKLCEQRAIDLDDDVNRYLPFVVRNPKHPGTAITFRMLLTHTSSIGDAQELQDSLYGPGDPQMSLAEVTTGFFDVKGTFYDPGNYLDFEPGSAWNYSNWNFVLIGYAVEWIVGQPFSEYSRDVLLEPLGMTTAGWHLGELDEERLVTLYEQLDSGEIRAVDPRYGWPGYSDGNLRAGVEEAAGFLAMVLNGGEYGGRQILESDTVREMLCGQGVENLPEGFLTDMGLVWHIGDLPETVYLHTGEPTGTIIAMMFNPETNSGFVSFVTGINLGTPEAVSSWVDYLKRLLRESAIR